MTPCLTLFNEVEEIDRRPSGIVLAQVAQNYDGEEAIEAVVARYPDLIFSGTMTHESWQPGDGYWGFTGIKGKAEWAAFALPEEDCPTVSQIARWASRIDSKIVRLTKDREFCEELLARAEDGKSADPAHVSMMEEGPTQIRTAAEVRAILNKLRAEAVARRG